MRTERFVVPEEARDWRLDQCLVIFYDELSRSFVQKLIKEGQVKVNRRPSKPGYRVRPGDEIQMQIPPPVTVEIEPEEIPLDILYEDASLIVVNKPPGMIVHPGAGRATGTLVNALLAHCELLSGIGGVERPGIVHRLDKDTSGVLVVAKTDVAHRDLSEQLHKHTVGRHYIALVCGIPAKEHWTADSFMGRSPRDRKKMAVVAIGGRRAITHFRQIETFKQFALLSVRLETGRTHQIRVHLAHSGYPVVGDPTYGGGRQRALKSASAPMLKHALAALKRQALHAEQLAFLHPVTRERMEFTAPIPPDMTAVLDALRIDS